MVRSVLNTALSSPGRHFALNLAKIAIASILATLDIRKAKDASGKEIEIEVGFSSGLVRLVVALVFRSAFIECNSHPDEFMCSIKPRSPEHEKLTNSAL